MSPTLTQVCYFKMHRTIAATIVALFLVVATESHSLKNESKKPGVATALKAYFQNNKHRSISRNKRQNSECEKVHLEADGPKYGRCQQIFFTAIGLQPLSIDNITTYCITDECYKYLHDIDEELIEKCSDDPGVSRSDYLCNTIISSTASSTRNYKFNYRFLYGV